MAGEQSLNGFTGSQAGRALRASWRKVLPERIITIIMVLCTMMSVLTTAGIVFVLLFQALQFFGEVSFIEFITGTRWTPLFASKHFGVLALVSATLLTAILAMVVALPLGLLSAIFLSEYSPERVRRVVKPVLEVLAGIPTVVYGYFALLFVTPILQSISEDIFVFNAMSASIVMGIMILPMVASLSEDAMRAVPALAAGSGLRPGRNQAGGLDAGGGAGGPFRHRIGLHPGSLPGHRRDDDRYHRRRSDA